ncbi:hypothetical protein QCA50_017372 [Cerrena zonata]|uniref:MYND-type domain-containing protein n=1 Tax=Cerrena zonata TaxID=2478898 RepID=A0AAW0FSJ1_9APHY
MSSMKKTASKPQTARHIWKSLKTDHDIHNLIRRTPHHVVEVLRFMEEEKDPKLCDLLHAIEIYDSPNAERELPWSVFKTIDLTSALLDVAIGRLMEWRANPLEIPTHEKIELIALILSCTRQCASHFPTVEAREPYFRTFLSEGWSVLLLIHDSRDELLNIPHSETVRDSRLDAKIATSLETFIVTYIEHLGLTRSGEAFLLKNHILFSSLVLRAWTRAMDPLPHIFSRLSGLIRSAPESEMMDPIIQSALDSEAFYRAFLDKTLLLLLEEYYIDQRLLGVVTSLTQVVLVLDLQWGRIIGVNPRTCALLSGIISACQRQLCLGSSDFEENSIAVQIFQEALHSIHILISRAFEREDIDGIPEGLMSADLLRLLAIMARIHPLAQRTENYHLRSHVSALLSRFVYYSEENPPSFLNQSVIRHYLTRAAIPALQTLYTLPHLRARELPGYPQESPDVSGLECAIHLWHEILVKYVPELAGKPPRSFVHTGMEEFAVGCALLAAQFQSAWSMKCHWEDCLCAFVFSTYTRSQLQTPEEPWEPIRIHAPHEMKVCKGCWKVWYCGRRCQER